MRNGLRIGDLKDFTFFESRLRSLVLQLQSAYPELKVDVEKEISYYREVRTQLLPMVTDTVQYCNDALQEGKNILVEGANATSNANFINKLQFIFCLWFCLRILQ